MTDRTLVFAYPDGQVPAFYVQDPHVFSYPGQALEYWVNGDFWYRYPDGKEPVYYQKDGYLWDYPTPTEPKFQIKPAVTR